MNADLKKLRMLKEEKVFIWRALNSGFHSPKRKDELYKKLLKVTCEIRKVESELKNVENRDTNQSSN